jgi:transcriptional regulator with XRE-family HTH domain
MDNIYDSIGKKIAELRSGLGGKGITQEDLAKLMKTTANTISRWEKAVYKPSVEELQRLAHIFGVSISVFFPGLEMSQPQRRLMSATGDLNEKDLNELIEYAKFRKARNILAHARGTRRKKKAE